MKSRKPKYGFDLSDLEDRRRAMEQDRLQGLSEDEVRRRDVDRYAAAAELRGGAGNPVFDAVRKELGTEERERSSAHRRASISRRKGNATVDDSQPSHERPFIRNRKRARSPLGAFIDSVGTPDNPWSGFRTEYTSGKVPPGGSGTARDRTDRQKQMDSDIQVSLGLRLASRNMVRLPHLPTRTYAAIESALNSSRNRAARLVAISNTFEVQRRLNKLKYTLETYRMKEEQRRAVADFRSRTDRLHPAGRPAEMPEYFNYPGFRDLTSRKSQAQQLEMAKVGPRGNILDELIELTGRPQLAMATGVQHLVEGKSDETLAEAAWRGLRGNGVQSWGDVIKDRGPIYHLLSNRPKAQRYYRRGRDLALDLTVDPLVGLGAAKALFKAAGKAPKYLKSLGSVKGAKPAAALGGIGLAGMAMPDDADALIQMLRRYRAAYGFKGLHSQSEINSFMDRAAWFDEYVAEGGRGITDLTLSYISPEWPFRAKPWGVLIDVLDNGPRVKAFPQSVRSYVKDKSPRALLGRTSKDAPVLAARYEVPKTYHDLRINPATTTLPNFYGKQRELLENFGAYRNLYNEVIIPFPSRWRSLERFTDRPVKPSSLISAVVSRSGGQVNELLEKFAIDMNLPRIDIPYVGLKRSIISEIDPEILKEDLEHLFKPFEMRGQDVGLMTKDWKSRYRKTREGVWQLPEHDYWMQFHDKNLTPFKATLK